MLGAEQGETQEEEEEEAEEEAEELKEEYTSGGKGAKTVCSGKREKNNRDFVYEPRVGKLRDARLRNACVRS